ncbi:hypothetical protein DSCW_50940 [Desulfosarcina widdelii]|uniref:PBS lyase n=1 Tax=Desulfosarcina widdelii TaxID=947919 RepID=A0A5K7ZNB9_9BACT|nr:hypothetical protein [Desulfosarcina widdelii]BBO77677.1 hypothetical protein DSCW_50940 [Desulfosarcina widdelii]
MAVFKAALGCMIVVYLGFQANFVSAGEAIRHSAGARAAVQKSSLIRRVESLPPSQALEYLTHIEILSDAQLLDQAIHQGFGHRRKQAVVHSLGALRQPINQILADGSVVSRGKLFYVVGKVIATFDEEAVTPLLECYRRGDAITRANVVRVCGDISGDPRIRRLLVEALEDRDFYEDTASEANASGDPMRVCDLAYNQIVLHYQVRSVPRMLGRYHRLKTRDRYIGMLKAMMAS